MAGSLQDHINQAQVALKKAFGKSYDLEGKGADRFLNLNALADAYKEEVTFKIVADQFARMAQSIRNMRSSYLPIEFFLDSGSSIFNATISSEIADNTSLSESYENAFMRMLGMPSVGTTEFALNENDALIRSGETLKIVSPDSGMVSEVSFEEVKREILTQRQLNRAGRKIKIDNNIFNLSPEAVAAIEQQGPSFGDIFNGNASPPEVDTVSFPKIDAIEDDLWKFSYLLIPPIQDIEISNHINEPDKIVAEPFTDRLSRTINGQKTRPTLLESIIRIRLDKVSGTDTFVEPEVDEDDFGDIGVSFGTGEQLQVNTDTYGVLESLFILRLYSAIGGLARKMIADIDALLAEIEKNSRIPSSAGSDTGADSNNDSAFAGTQMNNKETDETTTIPNAHLELIKQQKLIEDSILFLLGDNSTAIDLQSKTQRNSSIHDAHMMSGIISVIDVPRKRLDQELKDINQSRDNTFGNITEAKRTEICATLGTDIGIGTLDIAVFSLALFLMPEDSLLGLLSSAQYERIRNGEFKELVPGDGDKKDTIESLNELTDLVIQGYNLFIQELRSDPRSGIVVAINSTSTSSSGNSSGTSIGDAVSNFV